MAWPPLTLRIVIPQSGATDWSVSPEKINFAETLNVINSFTSSHNLDYSECHAFEYEDEDGDRITVRNADDVTAMLSYYLNSMCSTPCISASPLVIFPKLCSTPARRNVHGLKVHTDESPPSDAPSSGNKSGSSSRQQSGDIGEILCTGSVAHADLEFLNILGTGTSGTVYRAQHKVTSTTMAVKVIRLDVSMETQSQILSELSILHKCRSEVIIGFYGAYFLEDRISICTEFMDGGSLDKFGRINEEEILGRVALSVVTGLHYLWSFKIMHRDVKPSNVLVGTQGLFKLCDFGVSVQLMNSIAKSYVGTRSYMAPERLVGENYSIQADVWSLGISLFKLALGKFPFEQLNNQSCEPLKLIHTINHTTPEMLPNSYSDAFIHFVAQCIQRIPAARASPEQLLMHPFLLNFDDNNKNITADWIQQRLHTLKLETSFQ